MEAPLRCTDTEGGRRKENQPSGTSSLHFSPFFPLIFVLFFFHDEATAVVLSPSSAFISGSLSSLDILHSVPPASAPRITPFYKLPQHLNCFNAIRKNLNAKKEQQNKLFALVDSGPALPPPNQPISPTILPTALRSGADVFSHLLHFQRKIFLWGPLTEDAAAALAAQLFLLHGETKENMKKDKIRSRGGYLLQKQQPSSPAAAAAAAAGAAGAGASASMSSNSSNVEGDASAAVEIVINSRGGSLTAGLALYDILSLLSPLLPVKTLAVGTAGHIASLLLAAGSKGKRKATKNTKIFCCESACTAQGSADELIQQTASVEGQEKLFEFLLSKHTDTPQGEVAEWRRQCRVFTAQEAKEKGIIDAVIPEGN